MSLSHKQILEKVRAFAKQAKASGKGWHQLEGGIIQCKNNRCTLGAIAYAASESSRKEEAKKIAAIQKEYEATWKAMSKKLQAFADKVSDAGGELFFSDPEFYLDPEFDEPDGNPSAGEAQEYIEGLSDVVAQTIIAANDCPLSGWEEGSLDYKARLILEEVLLNKKH